MTKLAVMIYRNLVVIRAKHIESRYGEIQTPNEKTEV
jgi:hypothetical protein